MSSMTIKGMTKDSIRANVIYDWSKQAKFAPSERVNFNGGDDFVYSREQLQSSGTYSNVLMEYYGHVGKVVAVSAAKDGKIRGASEHGFGGRQFTRYYVEFTDGRVFGIHSHHLTQLNNNHPQPNDLIDLRDDQVK